MRNNRILQARHQKKLMRKERIVSGRKILDEMQEEEENSDTGFDQVGRSKAAKMMKALIEREKYEMDNMKRLPMSILAKKELRQFNKKQLHKQGGVMLDDLSGFASDVLDVSTTKRGSIHTGLNAAAQTLRQDILEAERLRMSDASFKPMYVYSKTSLSYHIDLRRDRIDRTLAQRLRHFLNLRNLSSMTNSLR